MIVFIDESGSFSNPQKKKNVVSCVGALAVPEDCIDYLFAEFTKLKEAWGVSQSDEMKGSKLSEKQANELVQLCAKYDICLKVIATDIGLHAEGEVSKHKINQSNTIRKSAEGATEEIGKELSNLAEGMEGLSEQLYAQSVLMTVLLDKVIREITLYYCQRNAIVLGDFHWVVDAKDKVITDYEKIWSTICMPFLQTISLADPLIQIHEGDYSAFEKYYGHYDSPPAHLVDYLDEDKRSKPLSYVDIKKVLKSLHFSDSKKELGLQLADLLVTIVRRAFSGTLQIDGWGNIGKLMLQVKKGEYPVHFVGLGSVEKATTPYGKIVAIISEASRSPFK